MTEPPRRTHSTASCTLVTMLPLAVPPLQIPPSSHCSFGASMMVLPQEAGTGSHWQEFPQNSLFVQSEVSSHSSPGSITPSPHCPPPHETWQLPSAQHCVPLVHTISVEQLIQVSPGSTVPFPQNSSMSQVELHPSPLKMFPSSHPSLRLPLTHPAFQIPSPQTGNVQSS